MLHAGQSLEIFKKWCTDEKNCIIMPGYCVAGTVGHRILHGERRIQMGGRIVDIKMKVLLINVTHYDSSILYDS